MIFEQVQGVNPIQRQSGCHFPPISPTNNSTFKSEHEFFHNKEILFKLNMDFSVKCNCSISIIYFFINV